MVCAPMQVTADTLKGRAPSRRSGPESYKSNGDGFHQIDQLDARGGFFLHGISPLSPIDGRADTCAPAPVVVPRGVTD